MVQLIAGLMLACVADPVGAADPRTQAAIPAECPDVRTSAPVRCTQSPDGYRSGWLRVTAPSTTPSQTVSIRTTRVEAIAVLFRYADGATVRQRVRSGAFDTNWAVGGALTFTAPVRAANLVETRIDFARPAWHQLLNIRIGDAPDPRVSPAAVLIIGAGLALLAISALCNLLIGGAARRAAPVWNAAWAFCVLGWALLWTQVALYLAPGLAGTISARLATLFSTAAVSCAGGFFLASAGARLSFPARRALQAMSIAVFGAGLHATMADGAGLPTAALLLNGSVGLAALLLTAVCLIEWRRGNREARAFLLSFTFPMLAVLWSIFADRGVSEDDAGGLYLVLVACALQTIWLTISSAFQLWSVRLERDAAQAAESRLSKLAETDALTGVLNRRGFVQRAEALLAGSAPVSLILIDLDRFKQVNDSYGHDTGDAVLRATAAALTWLYPVEAVGRLGGEEFGILAAGLAPGVAVELANAARAAIGAEEVWTERGYISVTASAGVSCAPAGTELAILYKAADRALYAAKHAGRDRTELAATLACVA